MPIEVYTEEYFMRQALLEAEKALEAGEIPVGLEAGHVHGISTKTFHINAVVPHDVSVEPIIMPHFPMLFVLKPGFENLQQFKSVVEIVNPQCIARSIAETVIKVFSRIHTQTSHKTIPNGAL